MRKIITILSTLLMCTFFCNAQKSNRYAYKYKYVDTLIQYDDAQTLTYRDKSGKFKTDTIYDSKMNSFFIDEVDVLIIEDKKLKQDVSKKSVNLFYMDVRDDSAWKHSVAPSRLQWEYSGGSKTRAVRFTIDSAGKTIVK